MRVRLSHLCSERVSLLVSLIEWPGIVSQNGLFSAKTSACCFSFCQQHCTIFGNLLRSPLNLTCGSFLNLLKWISSKMWFCSNWLLFFFSTRSPNGNTQMTLRNLLFKLTSCPYNCPLASLQIKDWIVTINNICPSNGHLHDIIAIKRTGITNSTNPGLSISHSSSR